MARKSPTSKRQRVLDVMHELRSGTAKDVAARLPHMTAWECGHYLCSLGRYGALHSARTSAKHSRYFVDRDEAQQYLQVHGAYVPPALRGDTAASQTVTLRHATMRLDPAQVTIQRDGAQVTVGRPYTHDPRYQFPPDTTRLPPGMQGAGFVADWQQRRGQA